MRALLVPVLAALAAQPALTAANVVPPASGGSGAGAISGYTISSVSYSLDGETIEVVYFDIAPANAATVNVRLAPTEPWSTCAVAAGTATCAVSTPVAAVAQLEVVAAS